MTNPALDLFNDRLPHKPYFSDDLHFGVRIAGKERAILAKYIQFNQPHAMFWLGFDVDRLGAAIDWKAPAPTLTITNPENGHAHLLYALKTSIRTAPVGKMKPLKYAAAVENALRKKLDADVGYSGLICKSPNHDRWKIAVWQPVSFSEDNRTYFRSRMHCNNKGQSKKSLSVSEYYPTECKLDPTCICCLAENFVFQ